MLTIPSNGVSFVSSVNLSSICSNIWTTNTIAIIVVVPGMILSVDNELNIVWLMLNC